MVDLDNEIIEVIVTREPIAAMIAVQPNRLVVVTVARIFAPGVLGADGANRQKRAWSRMTIGPRLATSRR